MALQTINLGTYPNDGTGDDLRTAFQKVNANLTELYSSIYGSYIGPTPPTTGVEEGELWWSTVDGKLYVRYSGAWIEASPQSNTVADISNHNLRDLGDVSDNLPTVGQALVWSGTAWEPGNVSAGAALDLGTFAAPAGTFLDLGTF